MNLRLWLFALGVISPSIALAQRDAPVWECYLSSIKVAHPHRESDLQVDLIFDRSGGPHEHTEHQMYLLSYLEKDEEEVLAISKDIALLDKQAEGSGKQFFDVLLERGLVTVLDQKVAPRAVPPDLNGREYTDDELERLHDSDFSFTLSKDKLFESLGKLKHFDAAAVRGDNYYEDTFKLMVFVPVNDSKYATEVKEGVKGVNDFSNGGWVKDANGRPLGWSTPILYFRPLPYEFEFRRLQEGKDAGMLLLYIN